MAALLARRPAAPKKSKRFARGARFESRFEYLVEWEDRDPATGERYEPSWEPTSYITPAAIEAYYVDKYEATDAPPPPPPPAPENDAAADGASAMAIARQDVPGAAAHNTTPPEATPVTAAPAPADDAPERQKNTRADDAVAPKRQKSTRAAIANTKEKEKPGAVEAGAAAAPRKRGSSPAPDRGNTKRIRVADMLLT